MHGFTMAGYWVFTLYENKKRLSRGWGSLFFACCGFDFAAELFWFLGEAEFFAGGDVF